MADDKVPVCVFHGGFFRTSTFEYLGGKMTIIDINLKAGKLCYIIDAIDSLGGGNIDALYYSIPGLPIKEGLRIIQSDGDVVDMLYHQLHWQMIDIYVEYVDDDEDVDKAIDDEERLVEVEHSSDDNDEDLVEARRLVREYSLRHRVQKGVEKGYEHEVYHSKEALSDSQSEGADSSDDEEHFEFNSLADQQDGTAGTLEPQLSQSLQLHPSIDNSGYQTEYHSSDDQGSLHSDIDQLSEQEVIVHTRRSRFPRYDRDARDPAFIVGMTFEDSKEFKEAIVRYSVAKQRPIKFIKNTSVRVRAKCAQANCKWMIYGGIDNRTKSFHLKTFIDEHTCNISFHNKRVHSSYLAKHYMILVSAMPKISAGELKNIVREQLGVNVTISQCRRTKLLVMKQLQGNYKKEYGQMWDYLAELRNSSQTSTFKMRVDRPIPNSQPFFDKAYFCFDACRKGFLAGCRPIIGLDGCFLKGLIKGELLCAVGRDANNQMYPIAWAVVRVENKENWKWFIELLKDDLDMDDGKGWALISDQQKGLLPTIAELLPRVEHRMCARHIYSNWGQHYKGKLLLKQFWKCAKSTNIPTFEMHRQRLKELTPQGHDDLFKTDPKHWSKAFFNANIKCDVVDNNLCEAFNGRCVEARCKAIITMMEDIRVMIMTRLHIQREACLKWPTNYGPRIAQKLNQSITASQCCHLIWNGADGYEVRASATGDKFVVDLNGRTCSCRAWDISGIPCAHAVCAIQHRHNDPADYLDFFYSKDKFLSAYQYPMSPVQGEKFWPKTNKDAPQPPPVKKMPGRPKRSRRKQPIEFVRGDRMTRQGKQMTCSLCRVVGHNRKGCHLTKGGGASHQRPDESQDASIRNSEFGGAFNRECEDGNETTPNERQDEGQVEGQAHMINPKKRKAKAKGTTNRKRGCSSTTAEASTLERGSRAKATAQLAEANVTAFVEVDAENIGERAIQVKNPINKPTTQKAVSQRRSEQSMKEKMLEKGVDTYCASGSQNLNLGLDGAEKLCLPQGKKTLSLKRKVPVEELVETRTITQSQPLRQSPRKGHAANQSSTQPQPLRRKPWMPTGQLPSTRRSRSIMEKVNVKHSEGT